MTKNTYKIEGMTIAVKNMDKMLSFYSEIFGIRFEKKELYQSELYSSEWGGLKVLFCPAELAENTAEQNRHQFDITVSNLDDTIGLAKDYGGEIIGQVTENEFFRTVGIYDPDKNSIVFKEIK